MTTTARVEDKESAAGEAAASSPPKVASAATTTSSIVPASTSRARTLPRRIGSYTLFEPVGRGGMAELFLARTETELGATRLAVVKLILPAFSDDPKFAEMLIHEAKLAAGLSHRHIVQVLELGRHDEPDGDLEERRLFIAMEYVEGFDLNALLRKCTETKEGLPAQHALGIVADILEGLDYAHRRPEKIVHRDVSPSNILISYEGEVKLCDFGIAAANDLVREEASEALKGKAGYMSPEHARGEPLDARADVFAAGIILWELLTGRRLYKPRTEIPLLEQARLADIPPIPDKGLPHTDELQRIVKKALAPNKDDRYASAGAFQRDLEGYLAKAGLLASRLKLGEWLSSTFGTSLIEERRASESRLPKSIPPPRSSTSALRAALERHSSSSPAAAHGSEGVVVPLAPRLPSLLGSPPDVVEPRTDDVVQVLPEEESAPLFFEPSPSALPPKAKAKVAEEPSAPRAEMSDTTGQGTSGETEANAPSEATEEPNEKATADMATTKTGSPSLISAANAAASDDELMRWARKRGVISFLGFFSIAVIVALIWFATR